MCVPQWVYIDIASPEYDTYRFTASETLSGLSRTVPCGVWVIQIWYGGSPTKSQAGMPTK